MVKPNSLVASLPRTIPFTAPEEIERDRGAKFEARLGANEGNFGPSPHVIDAIERAARDDVWKYPDPSGHDLRAALADHLGLERGNIVLGPGIDGLLGLTVRIFSDAGEPIVTSRGAYPTFNFHVAAYGRALAAVPYARFHEDLDRLAAEAREQNAKIVYLSNPDNPMGTWHTAEAVIGFAQALPDNSLLILDEAYGETAPDGTLPAIGSLPGNVIRMRTFSKAYGLAGLRCGYAFGEERLIAEFDKVRDHFGVNVFAQAAGLAAIGDQAWLKDNLEHIAEARTRIAAIARANGLSPIASGTNFVTAETGQDGAYAASVAKCLEERGVFVRKPMAPGLDHCIRFSAGRPEELDILEAVLPQAIAATGDTPARD